jgi:hypothetical protein
LAKRPTNEELAMLLLKKIYETTDGKPMEWRMVAANNGTARAAIELAVDRGWLLVEGGNIVCLTDEGRNVVKKGLS